MQSGLVTENPVVGTMELRDSTPRERVLSLAELASVWRACDDGSEYGKIIRLLILLASRRGEIGGICFSELNLEQGTWTLPARKSKNGHSHSLPLGPMALDIIRSVPRMASRDALFGQRAGEFTAWGKNKRDLDQRSGVRAWTVHDIRRSVATCMADNGTPPHIIEEILNHRGGHRGGIAAVYNKSRYGNEVRAALLMWEDHVRTLVEGGERKVLPMSPPAS